MVCVREIADLRAFLFRSSCACYTTVAHQLAHHGGWVLAKRSRESWPGWEHPIVREIRAHWLRMYDDQPESSAEGVAARHDLAIRDAQMQVAAELVRPDGLFAAELRERLGKPVRTEDRNAAAVASLGLDRWLEIHGKRSNPDAAVGLYLQLVEKGDFVSSNDPLAASLFSQLRERGVRVLEVRGPHSNGFYLGPLSSEDALDQVAERCGYKNRASAEATLRRERDRMRAAPTEYPPDLYREVLDALAQVPGGR